MALGTTQPLTEMSSRNIPEGQGRLELKAENLAAMSESFVYIMWEPRRLATLWASTACYRDSFTFYINTKSDFLATFMYIWYLQLGKHP
jgi:hypothetical protein